ncbi:MAG: spore maturation protein [Deltaproteobacteria bacterium]
MNGLLDAISASAIPVLVAGIPMYAFFRKRVPVYEVFVEGAKEGFGIAVGIIPALVGMLVAINMFRASGALDLLASSLAPLLGGMGITPELLALAIVRPLSGSGSLALLADIARTSGPDSLPARIGATLIGSTETTFYVIAVYFGSVGIARFRYAVPAGLIADLAGLVASVLVCRWFFG